jgi:hypothetical protein
MLAMPHTGQLKAIMTGVPKRKGAPNQERSRNPRNGADRTAPGRRPQTGAWHKHRFCQIQGPKPRVAVFREALLDARASIKFFPQLMSGRGSGSSRSPVPRTQGKAPGNAPGTRKSVHQEAARCQLGSPESLPGSRKRWISGLSWAGRSWGGEHACPSKKLLGLAKDTVRQAFSSEPIWPGRNRSGGRLRRPERPRLRHGVPMPVSMRQQDAFAADATRVSRSRIASGLFR